MLVLKGSLVCWIVLCSLASISGCGARSEQPQLGQVTGTVKLQDKPLPMANVVFKPQTGRFSRGTTDASGQYELTYIRHEKGALIGSHSVSISTWTESTPERVPRKYNVQTTLTAEVKQDDNTFDFNL